MDAVRLTSRDNPLVKRIRLVLSETRRAPEGIVACEGLRVLEEAARAGAGFETVVVDQEFGSDLREAALLRSWDRAGTRVYRAARSLMRHISGVVAPQGAIALVRVPVNTLAGVRSEGTPLLLCACEVQDPGNLGSLIRAAAAAEGTLVCTTAGSVSARNSKCVRASAGAFFRIPVVERISPADFLTHCRSRGIRVYGTSPAAGADYRTVDFRLPSALVLGNEGRGLARREWGDVPKVRIPIAAGVESLNVAVAGAVLLLEAYHQRATGRSVR